MKVYEGLLVAAISTTGAVLGALVSSKSVVEAARAQNDASITVAKVQLQSAAAFKLWEVRSSAVSAVFSASSEFKVSSLEGESGAAARSLANAAANCAAQLDGELSLICLDLQEKASFFSIIPATRFAEQADSSAQILGLVSRLASEYRVVQAATLKNALLE